MYTQPFLVKKGSAWHFIQPQEVLNYQEEMMESKNNVFENPTLSERNYRKVIHSTGNGAVDAMLMLADVMDGSGRNIEASALIYKAHQVCLECIPEDFNMETDEIHWELGQNPTFLRTFYDIIRTYIKERQFKKALNKIHTLLRLNKTDNLKAQDLMPNCYLRAPDYKAFIELYDRVYATAKKPQIENEYGAFYAHYKLNQLRDAANQFKKAKKRFPHVAAELIQDEHMYPDMDFARALTHGIPKDSPQEAFLYWRDNADLWDGDEELREFMINIFEH